MRPCNPGRALRRPWSVRRPTLVPALAAALLLAGCAGAGPSTAAGSSGSPGAAAVPGSSPPGPAPSESQGAALPTNILPIAPGEPAQVGPARIDATGVPGGYTGRTTLDLEGTALTVTGTEGSCSTVTVELLGEDATSVSVQLVVTTTSTGVCTAIAKLVPLTVQLAAPLADRTVVLSEVRR